jgi:hypothetical protein
VITFIIYMALLALIGGMWWMARAKDKRTAEQVAAVRRTYIKDIASSPWIRRKSGELAGERPSAEDGDGAGDILEIGPLPGGGNGFRVPPKGG